MQCQRCNALRWPGQTPGFCCDNGRSDIPKLPKPPSPLDSLLLGETSDSSHFLSKIRSYNSAFQITSMGCNEVVLRQQWNPCFKIQGQVYHRIGSLSPEHEKPKFAQIYFVGDENEEMSLRHETIPGLKPSIVADLQQILHDNNSYVASLKMAHEILSTHHNEYKVVIDAEKRPNGEHERRYNAPSCNEVVVLISGAETGKRDIVLRHRDSSLERISETHMQKLRSPPVLASESQTVAL